MSKRGSKPTGLVPIGKVAVRLPGIEGRGRAMSAQARHHFTLLRQVNQLIEAGEAEPESWLHGAPDGLVFAASRSPLLWPCSGSDGGFPQIACESRGFPSVKQVDRERPIYRLNRWTLGPKLSVKQVDPSYSTDQVIRTNKYVQAAGGLFIFWFSEAELKKKPTRPGIKGMGRWTGATPADFPQ